MAFRLFPSHVPIVDKDGKPTREFIKAMEGLFNRVGGGSKVGPSAPTGLTYSIEAGGVRLQCDANPAAEEVIAYVWRIGASWENSLLLVNFSTNNELIPSDQVGTYTVWVAAADVRGNYSTPASMEVVVTDADLGIYGPKVTLTSTGIAFANGSPSSIDITALILNLPTPTYEWSVDGVVDATATNGTYTVNAFSGTEKVYRCTVTSGVSGLSAYGEMTIYSVADGAAGARGSLKGYGTQYGISVSAWSDAKANRVISNMLTGATGTTDLATTTHLRIGDTVQLTNSSDYVESKFWNGSAWIAAATVIEGNVLVNGQGVFTGDIIGASNLDITGRAVVEGNYTSGGYNAALHANESFGATHGVISRTNTTNGQAVGGISTNGGYGGYFSSSGGATGTGVFGIALAAGHFGVWASSALGTALKVTGTMTLDNSTFTWNSKSIAAPTGSTSTYLRNDGSWATPPGTSTVINGNTGTATASGGGWTMQMGTGLAPTYEVACSGNNVILQTASDQTLKQDIEDETHGLSFVNALRPRRFRFISDPEYQQHGFIAQEVAALATPNGELDALAFTNPNGKMGINHLSLIGPLVKAVQELTARLEALEAQP